MSFPRVSIDDAVAAGSLRLPRMVVRENVIRQEERYLRQLAEYCHTKVTAYAHDNGILMFEVGRTVKYQVTEETRRRVDSVPALLDEVAPHLRAAWFAYEPDIPPNVVLGEC